MRFNKFGVNTGIKAKFTTVRRMKSLGFVDYGYFWSFMQPVYEYDLFYEIRVYPKSGTVSIEVAHGAIVQLFVFDVDKQLGSNDTTVVTIAQAMYDIIYQKLKELEKNGLIYFENFEYGDPIIKYD